MDRHHQFNADDREGLVAELAEQRVRSWLRLLVAGDKRATADLQNLVLDRLAEEDAKQLFVQAVTKPQADISFAATVRDLMRDYCHTQAENAVDDMERGRAESRDDNRIAMSAASRMH